MEKMEINLNFTLYLLPHEDFVCFYIISCLFRTNQFPYFFFKVGGCVFCFQTTHFTKNNVVFIK